LAAPGSLYPGLTKGATAITKTGRPKMRIANLPVSVVATRLLPSRWDLVVVPLLLVTFVLLGHSARQMTQPLTALDVAPLTLDSAALPGYALRTTLRMLAALVLSIIFTLTYGTLAAKSRRAGALLVPLLDILQSVPILGFLSFTVTFFLGLFPGNVLGAECAAIFAIFRRTAEVPLFRIEKRPKLRNRQGLYAVIATSGQILKRGHDLAQVLRVFETRKPQLVE